MLRKFSAVRIVGYALVVFCGTSIGVYLPLMSIPEFHWEAVLFTVLFGIMFIASLGIIQRKKQARAIMLWLSTMTISYSLYIYFTQSDYVAMSNIFLLILVFLFLKRRRIKAQFDMRSEEDWQSVLIVDDDEAIIKTVRPILITNGFSVLSANNGEDGLRIAQTQQPDLILLDVILPGIKGRDLCRMLKEDSATKDIPIIFLTAKDSPDDVKAEKEAGAVAHLTKPVNVKELISVIKGVLE